MKKKMYKAKKQWVVAGVATASLFLAPGVLAEEAVPVNEVVVGETTSGSENVTPQPTNGTKTTSMMADSSSGETSRDLRDELSAAENV
ncbi:KxYKxGKxW signal peptide domain-containing protein, partial [Streptococcus jiangjianxini]|uniref:KxYKxGKxW signal peptide domain-containing protein n=1 Tax=Streptococcus jiangjianxini TaxID=3161189 RepID=UPI0032EC98DA